METQKGTQPENAPGTYALVMRLPCAQRVRIGKLGVFDFEAGWYVYVGSARGSGGIKSRTDRHLALRRENAKKPHYHIDYLRKAVIEEIWFSYDTASLEHEWSQAIMKHFRAEVSALGFGSKDCKAKCPAHLFRLAKRPVAAALRPAFNPSKKLIHLEFVRSPRSRTTSQAPSLEFGDRIAKPMAD